MTDNLELRLESQGPPLPSPQIMSQWWRDILFMHWRVDAGLMAPMLPAGATPDLFDGSAWVGLIPFQLADGAIGRGPAVPWLGTFWETNVRVYSTDEQGRHGVVFRSLETERLAAMLGARAAFGIPYMWASMSGARRLGPRGERQMAYATTRLGPSRAASTVTAEIGDLVAEPSPLEVFLTARFGLHCRHAGTSWWIPNTHSPWPLRRARVLTLQDGLVSAAGFPGTTERAPESVLFSEGVQSTFGVPTRLSARRTRLGA